MKKEQTPDIIKTKLSDLEEQFCFLFVYGNHEFAGQHTKCYMEVFGEDSKNMSVKSHKLMKEPHILARIKELYTALQNETENIAIKLQVAETLKAVMEETSTAQFSDKFGVCLSPAPLRAVSVNAAKALMDLFPIKHVQESKLRIEGSDGNVIFNVIVPEIKTHDEQKE